MRLRTLVVDDETDIRAECDLAFSGSDSLILDCASSSQVAFEMLNAHLYDLIIVDLELDRTRPTVLEGEDVLTYAAQRHPVADLYVWTGYPRMQTTTSIIIQKLLSPDGPVARRLCGVIDKTLFEAGPKAHDIATSLAVDRLWNPVHLDRDKLEMIVGRLGGSRSVIDWSEPVVIHESARLEEVEFLLSRLFGQGNRSGRTSVDRKVEIDFFDELGAQGEEGQTGSSGAAVFLARAGGTDGIPGEWVVVKVAGKRHVMNEVGRYERFVRYDRAAKHRVELMGYSLGNNVGAIAYSLAGPDPQRAQTIKSALRLRDPSALAVMSTLFSEEWKHWHGIPMGNANPMSFMQQEFEFRFLDRLEEFLDGIRGAVTWRAKQSTGSVATWWVAEGDRSLKSSDMAEIALPGQDLTNRLSGRVKFSICHGDSHAANIICGADNEPRLIDYAATGPGPRALDFAVFEASHRVIDADNLDIDGCARRILREQELWRAIWRLPSMTTESAEEIVASCGEFWEQLSATVLTRFRISFPDASSEEYARVAVLQGVRLAPVWWVEDSKAGAKRRKYGVRLRLAAWMGPLVECLRRSGTGV